MTTTKLHRTLLALPFVAAFALGACSDDDDDNAAAAGNDALTAAEFTTQANALCAEAGTAAEDALGPVFADFENATPEQLEEGYATMVDLARQLTADIDDLPEPESLRDDVAEWLDIFDQATDEIEEGGSEAFFASEGDPWLAANPGAVELGLDECAEA